MRLRLTWCSILYNLFGKHNRIMMNIRFAQRRLEEECNDQRLLQRRHGPRRAALLMRRLSVLAAATRLSDLGPPYQGPMRCHELTNNRAGQLSVDLDHPYRLILEPDHDPRPTRPDGGLNWNEVTAIKIIEIADTHE